MLTSLSCVLSCRLALVCLQQHFLCPGEATCSLSLQQHSQAAAAASSANAHLPNSLWKSSSLAQTMQWMGLSGVLRMVHTGKLLGAGLGLHSKHSVWPLMCTLACGQKDSTLAP